MKKTFHITISGVVQGIGFRPFIFNLANSLGVFGWVKNHGGHVEITVSGDESSLGEFAERIVTDAPPLAHFAEFTIVESDYQPFSDFCILPSDSGDAGVGFIPADAATCDKCTIDIFDKTSRRYLYPFTNCTDCGPRYTIIKSLPYDRKSTTMDSFEMCPECKCEYLAPSDRRFHAQPNACQVCGPEVWSGSLKGDGAIDYIARKIDDGEIVAIKGLGGYHLICDATNETAIKALRIKKGRATKPFAVMCKDISILKSKLDIPPVVEKTLTSAAAPIVIFDWGRPVVSTLINPMGDNIGVMLAYTPLHKILMDKLKTDFIVATSGNLQDEPICADIAEAEEKLSRFTPHFLHHNRDIYTRTDDSVTALSAGVIRVLRRGRGYAPFPVKFSKINDGVLFAAGAHLKNTFSLTSNGYCYVSQYIGDLDNVDTINYYKETIDNLTHQLGLKIDKVVCDLHPGYFSSEYASELGLPLAKVQHHKAHMMATMAEHGLSDNCIGVILDGTGYGEDGTIWGGELFVLKNREITRVMNITPVAQPGGDAAVKKPSQMAVSWLKTAGLWESDKEFLQKRLKLDDKNVQLIDYILNNNINCIKTSSAGRLFEAVGALVCGISENEFEGHAAIALEAVADKSYIRQGGKGYLFNTDGNFIDPSFMFSELVTDLKNGLSISIISAKFHLGFAMAIVSCCKKISKDYNIKSVVFSGGVFQNILLQELLSDMTFKAGFDLFMPVKIPANDGGISLGQAYYNTLLIDC